MFFVTITGRRVQRVVSRGGVGDITSVCALLGSDFGSVLRRLVRTRLSTAPNCRGGRGKSLRASGGEGNRSAGGLGDRCNRFRVSMPESHGNRFRPGLVPGCRESVSKVRRGIVSLCTHNVDAHSVRSRLRSLCKVRLSTRVIDGVASGVLPRIGR